MMNKLFNSENENKEVHQKLNLKSLLHGNNIQRNLSDSYVNEINLNS